MQRDEREKEECSTAAVANHAPCSCPFMLPKSLLLDSLLCENIAHTEEDLSDRSVAGLHHPTQM